MLTPSTIPSMTTSTISTSLQAVMIQTPAIDDNVVNTTTIDTNPTSINYTSKQGKKIYIAGYMGSIAIALAHAYILKHFWYVY